MERLDKLLASQGMLSRREVKELIARGRVTVDGRVEKRPERKVTGEEQITVAGEPLRVQRTLPLMLHKPQGYVSAARDARDKTVLELVPPEYRRKELFPAGRLDKDTTGLMILTDDGALAHEILAPKKHVPKQYRVTIDVPMTEEMVRRFAEGIRLKDGVCRPAELTLEGEHTGVVTLREGRYHQIKRMFGCCGGTRGWRRGRAARLPRRSFCCCGGRSCRNSDGQAAFSGAGRGCFSFWQVAPRTKNLRSAVTGKSRNIHIFMVN